MTNGTPILPFASAAIVDGNGKLTLEGTTFLRKIVTKLQGQITQLSDADANIVRLLASLTDANGDLVNVGAINLDELLAIAAVQAPGVMVRDVLGQWFGRTLAGTANRLTVTFGDGTQDNPTFDISATYAGQTSITTLGTITTGTWTGGVIAAPYGGTGQSVYAVGDILYASSTTALSKLGAGTATYVLTSNGAGVAPSWQASSGGGTDIRDVWLMG